MSVAFLVVDMLNDFVRDNGALPVPKSKEIVPAIKRRLEEARKNGWLVVYLVDTHAENDKEFEVWGKHAVKDTWGNQIIDELTPLPGEVVVPKRRFSGFFGTDLGLVLRENDIETVIVTGVLTNICVMYTASDAYQRGYRVVVPQDSVASVDDEMNRFAIRQMKEVVGAEIV